MELLQTIKSLKTPGDAGIYHDPWNRRDDAQVRFSGRCVVCKSRVYELSEDGQHFGDPDPRGPLGEKRSCACLVAKEYDATGADVVMCFDCANTRETYECGLSIARERWAA